MSELGEAMSDIQRWDMNHVQGEVYIDKKPEGSWVTYADHLAAVAAAEQRVTERHNAEHEDDRLAAFQNGYDAATVKERQRSVLLIADAYGKALSAAREQIVAYLRDETQHPSIEAGAWAYSFTEVIEQGSFNGTAETSEEDKNTG